MLAPRATTAHRRQAAVWALGLALGASAVVAQSVLLRELSLLWFGSELSWGMTLAFWLAGVSVGAGGGGIVVGRVRAEAAAAAFALALSGTFPAALWFLRCARGLLAGGMGEFIPLPQMLLVTALTAGTVGLWTGALFPAGCALVRNASTRAAVGTFFAAEAVGALIGGAAFTFWWVGRIDAFSLWAGLSGAMLLTLAWAEKPLSLEGRGWPAGPGEGAAPTLTLPSPFKGEGAPHPHPALSLEGRGVFAPHLRGALPSAGNSRGGSADGPRAVLWLCPAALIVVALAGILAWLGDLTGWADQASAQRRWRDLAGSAEHVAGAESPFARIDLGRLGEQWTLYLNCQPAETFPNRVETAPYAHLAASQAAPLGRVLVLGEATGQIAAELARYPGAEVETVQLDRKVREILASNVVPVPPAPTQYADGRQYLKSSPRRYDLILLSPADTTSIAASRFYTCQFFRLVRGHLTDGGVLALALPGPAEQIAPPLGEYLASVYRALAEAFPETLWTWGDPVYAFAAGRAGVLTDRPEELIRRYRAHVGPEDFDPDFFLSWREDRLQPARLAKLKAALAGAAIGANTDNRPLAMYLASRRHEQTLLGTQAGPAGPRRLSLLALLAGVRAGGAVAVVLAIGAAVCAVVIVQRRRGKALAPGPVRLPALFSLATTGAAGMALEIVLLAAFQNLYGYVYSHIALIVAVYMAGVAAGGWLASRPGRPAGAPLGRRLLILDVALCLGCLATPLVLQGLAELPGGAGVASLSQLATEGCIFVLLFAAGLAGGLAVPWAAGLYGREASGPHRLKTCATSPPARGSTGPRRGTPAFGREPAGPTDGAADQTGKVAGAVDAADCLGGAVGGLSAGLVLLPLLGATATCLLAALLKLSSQAALLLAGAETVGPAGSRPEPVEGRGPAGANGGVLRA